MVLIGVRAYTDKMSLPSDEIIDTAGATVGFIVIGFPPAHPATLPVTASLVDRATVEHLLQRCREMTAGHAYRYAPAEVRLLEEPR